jgi:hypothetical protein
MTRAAASASPAPVARKPAPVATKRQVQAALAAPVPEVSCERHQVRGQAGRQGQGPGPGERGHAGQQPGRQQRYPGRDQPDRQLPGPVPAGYVGQEEHRPELFRNRDISQPEPAEQADDRVREHGVPGQVEPVPAPVGYIGDPEARGRHEPRQREPQPGNRVTLPPRGQRGGEVHRQQGDRDRGQASPGFHHRLPLRGDPGRQQRRSAQPGHERDPGQGDRP